MPSLLRTRFLVVGSGVAGLHTAWRASVGADVMLLTKRSLFDSATAYAQGRRDRRKGAGRGSCPHVPGAAEFGSWLNGWDDEAEAGVRRPLLRLRV